MTKYEQMLHRLIAYLEDSYVTVYGADLPDPVIASKAYMIEEIKTVLREGVGTL